MEQHLSMLLAGSQEPRAYGCLSCVAGRETAVIRRMQDREPSVRAFAAMREKHKIADGIRSRVPDVMLPGYVFFEASESFDPITCFRMISVNRVLCTDKDEWRLKGSDLAFTKWLFEMDGMLGFSTAYRTDSGVHFESGPLQALGSAIRKVDWHARRARVQIPFDGQLFSVWLCFDRVDPPPASVSRDACV